MEQAVRARMTPSLAWTHPGSPAVAPAPVNSSIPKDHDTEKAQITRFFIRGGYGLATIPTHT
eukprot:1144964-Pelagomonas_calceolata.AAC.9